MPAVFLPTNTAGSFGGAKRGLEGAIIFLFFGENLTVIEHAAAVVCTTPISLETGNSAAFVILSTLSRTLFSTHFAKRSKTKKQKTPGSDTIATTRSALRVHVFGKTEFEPKCCQDFLVLLGNMQYAQVECGEPRRQLPKFCDGEKTNQKPGKFMQLEVC